MRITNVEVIHFRTRQRGRRATSRWGYGVWRDDGETEAAHLHLAAAAPEATCRYYERGLLRAEFDYESPPPHLTRIVDPLDADGHVCVSTDPGLGIAYDWDFIDANRID